MANDVRLTLSLWEDVMSTEVGYTATISAAIPECNHLRLFPMDILTP